MEEKYKNLALHHAPVDFYFQTSFYEWFGNLFREATSYRLPALISGYSPKSKVISDSALALRQVNNSNIQKKLLYFLNLSLKEKNSMRKKTYETFIKQHLYERRLKELKKLSVILI